MKSFGIVFLLVAIGLTTFAQPALSTKNKKAIEYYVDADNYRVRGEPKKAIELLNQAIAKDKNFEEAYFRLGITLKNETQLQQSSDAYEKGLALVADIRKKAAYHYELGDNYLRLGNYAKAMDYLDKYLAVDKAATQNNQKARLWKQHAQYGIDHAGENLGYKTRQLSDTINAFPMQYFPALTADNRQIIFTKRDGHGHEDDEDIYTSYKNDLGQWSAPVSISPKVNSNNREGAATLSADGRYLIFSVCGGRGYGRCDLFESKKNGNEWSLPLNLGPLVNGRDWDVQPTLSADGQELYFVSDRRGGLGGSDIWYTKKDSTGRWVRAINAGPVINTKFDETSPFIHVNNRNLYFASNGHPGFGGLDIFVAEKNERKWSAPKNMGAPLNNFEDQFSFFVTADGKRAYYAKDNADRSNYTRLYVTDLPEQAQVKYSSNVVKGKVRDKADGKPVQADVELYDIAKKERISLVQSDSTTGDYTIVLTKGSEYALYSSAPGYLFASLSFNYATEKDRQPVIVNIELQKASVNAIAVLNNIFFNTDKFELNSKSNTELEEIIRFLKNNPAIRVEIGGYTDNVGAESYNLQLSQKRAQSVATYLAEHGIACTRVSQKGYGSQHPVKPNDSDDNRAANRRIEFRIIK